MTMKNLLLCLLFTALLLSCNDEPKAPDISHIRYDAVLKRFDRDLFSVDTLQLEQEMTKLGERYPQLLNYFLGNIVGVSDPASFLAFYRSYRPVYDSAQLIYADFDPVKRKLEEALRYVKFYFPDYTLPKDIVPVLGPLDTREDLARMSNGELTPNFLGPDMLGISLQFYMGASYSIYNTEYFVNNVAPLFRSRRFSKEYITADVMRLIADDLYPDRSYTQSLVEQMIERGKRWWLMEHFMPGAPDTLITGYTQAQTEWTEENEGMIWSFIAKNERLDSKEPAAIQTYIGEAPFTIGLPQEYSPGAIGIWLGRQIVRKYAREHSDASIDEIMKMPAEKLLQESKYRPK